jgi:hypothetical protein
MKKNGASAAAESVHAVPDPDYATVRSPETLLPMLREYTEKVADSTVKWCRSRRWLRATSALFLLPAIWFIDWGLSHVLRAETFQVVDLVLILVRGVVVLGTAIGVSLLAGRFLFPESGLVRDTLRAQHRHLKVLITLASRVREHAAVSEAEKLALDGALAEADVAWAAAERLEKPSFFDPS